MWGGGGGGEGGVLKPNNYGTCVRQGCAHAQNGLRLYSLYV